MLFLVVGLRTLSGSPSAPPGQLLLRVQPDLPLQAVGQLEPLQGGRRTGGQGQPLEGGGTQGGLGGCLQGLVKRFLLERSLLENRAGWSQGVGGGGLEEGLGGGLEAGGLEERRGLEGRGGLEKGGGDPCFRLPGVGGLAAKVNKSLQR